MELSIVSPVYRNEDSLVELVERVKAAVSPHVKEWEFVLVVDGSPDGSLAMLREIGMRENRVKVLSFTRNFGQHAAILAGLQCATGELIFILDADLEEEPECFGQFLTRLREGFDLVVGVRENKRRSALKEWTAQLYYWLQGKLTDFPIIPNVTNMRLMTRKFARNLLRFSERPFFGGFTVWVGGNVAKEPVAWVDRERRSGFGLRKLVSHSRLGVLAFSTRLLRLSSAVGAIISTGAFAFGVFLVISFFVGGRPLPGFTSLATLLTFVLGLQCIFMGILGEYIGEIFEAVKKRPRYLVDEAINLEDLDDRCVG